MYHYQPHPYGVLPSGNDLDSSVAGEMSSSASTQARRRATLGPSLGRISTEVLLNDVFTFLSVCDLVRVSGASAALYVLSNTPDLWRNVAIVKFGTKMPLRYHGTWKETVTGHEHVPRKLNAAYCNDFIFQSWLCTTLPGSYRMKEGRRYMRRIPRVSAKDITPDEFYARYECGSQPVILTDAMEHWPLYKAALKNSVDTKPQSGDASVATNLAQLFPPGKLFQCESFNMTIEEYFNYAAQQRDERPIYLFDPHFVDTAGDETAEEDEEAASAAHLHPSSAPGTYRRNHLYTVPEVFQHDLFDALQTKRPLFRWLIAGPANSGSSFHVDPNRTSAWNAVITGKKRWIFFPPNVVPPGVFPSDDMSDVATPVSLTEWLLQWNKHISTECPNVGYEGVCNAGEIAFVPSQWWHTVVNLEPSVAVTQNYLCPHILPSALHFLKKQTNSISGVGEDDIRVTSGALQARRLSFCAEFIAALQVRYPEILEEAQQKLNWGKELGSCGTGAAEPSVGTKRSRKAIDLLPEEDGAFQFDF